MTRGDLPRHAMDLFDFDLPAELIAQEPLQDRSGSRLLTLDRRNGEVDHRAFVDLPDLLEPGDLLVVNDSKVLPARLVGQRASGGEVEFLLLHAQRDGLWSALIRPQRRLRIGEEVEFAPRVEDRAPRATGTVVDKLDDGLAIVRLDAAITASLVDYGRVPLPPYIDRVLEDDDRYQTVYAADHGSAAAPTAGLHFTDDMFRTLADRGVRRADVTLHIGLDTFRPVVTEYAEDHRIHSEWCSVPEATAIAIRETIARDGRIVAVGTTSARTLETYARSDACAIAQPFAGSTRVFITPGYAWRLVDGMVTNFHLPRSSLLLMVSALAGRDRVLAAYAEAIRERYRFFSFGDAMLIL